MVKDVIGELQSTVNKLLRYKHSLRILEAGCGSSTHIRFDKDTYIVGIDVSEKQLERNSILNQKIQGDIQYYKFEPSAFDVIICWDVLEHLPKPELALYNFVNAVRNDGIIVLKMPNFWSFKGLVTKYSPLWFHTMYYKYIFKSSHAVKINDYGPFKTYLRSSISRNAIYKFAASQQSKIVYSNTYDVNLAYKSKLLHYTYKTLSIIARIISFNKLSESELIIAIQKHA